MLCYRLLRDRTLVPARDIAAPAAPTVIVPSPNNTKLAAWGDFDFISAYTDYADIAEIPREAHEATACQLIASLLNKNGLSIVHQGNVVYTLDLWQILISESGGGRSTLLRGVKSLLRKAELQGVLKDSHWGSEAAMYQHFAENPHSFMVWGESSEMLGRINNYGYCKAWLTDRYDDTDPPNDRTYRKTNIGRDTPDIKFPVPPRTNIMATSSEGWFFRNMKTDDSSGGFLPRWLLVRTGTSRDVSTVPEFDLRKQSVLVEYLKRIDSIRGKADISQILPYYDDDAWYKPTKRRFLTQTDPTLGQIYFNRHRAHVFKLAVVYEVARSGSIIVSREAWDRAVATAKRLENILFDLLSTGMNERGWEINRIEDLIRDAGAKGIERWIVGRKLRSIPDLQKHIDTLARDRLIRTITRQTKGAPGVIFIHQDHITEAEA